MKFGKLFLVLTFSTIICSAATTKYVVNSDWFGVEPGGNKEWFSTNILPTLINYGFDENSFTISNNVVYFVGGEVDYKKLKDLVEYSIDYTTSVSNKLELEFSDYALDTNVVHGSYDEVSSSYEINKDIRLDGFRNKHRIWFDGDSPHIFLSNNSNNDDYRETYYGLNSIRHLVDRNSYQYSYPTNSGYFALTDDPNGIIDVDLSNYALKTDTITGYSDGTSFFSTNYYGYSFISPELSEFSFNPGALEYRDGNNNYYGFFYGGFKFSGIFLPFDGTTYDTWIIPKLSDGVVHYFASTDYVDNHSWSWSSITNAPNLNNYVRRTGNINESITGTKTFSTGPIIGESGNRVKLQSNQITLMDGDNVTGRLFYPSVTNNQYFALTSNSDGTSDIELPTKLSEFVDDVVANNYVPLLKSNDRSKSGISFSQSDSRFIGANSLAWGGLSAATNSDSVALGNNNNSYGFSSISLGTGNIASGDESMALGMFSRSTHDSSFTWNGSSTTYGSHGVGTFNVNPIGGTGGFYIGNKTLLGHIKELSPNELHPGVGITITNDVISIIDSYINNLVDNKIRQAITSGIVIDGSNYVLVVQPTKSPYDPPRFIQFDFDGNPDIRTVLKITGPNTCEYVSGTISEYWRIVNGVIQYNDDPSYVDNWFDVISFDLSTFEITEKLDDYSDNASWITDPSN